MPASPLAPIRKYLWLVILVLCVLVGVYAATLDADAIAATGHYGFLSMLPAIAAIVICFATRNVILALFMGVVFGGLITTRGARRRVSPRRGPSSGRAGAARGNGEDAYAR